MSSSARRRPSSTSRAAATSASERSDSDASPTIVSSEPSLASSSYSCSSSIFSYSSRLICAARSPPAAARLWSLSSVSGSAGSARPSPRRGCPRSPGSSARARCARTTSSRGGLRRSTSTLAAPILAGRPSGPTCRRSSSSSLTTWTSSSGCASTSAASSSSLLELAGPLAALALLELRRPEVRCGPGDGRLPARVVDLELHQLALGLDRRALRAEQVRGRARLSRRSRRRLDLIDRRAGRGFLGLCRLGRRARDELGQRGEARGAPLLVDDQSLHDRARRVEVVARTLGALLEDLQVEAVRLGLETDERRWLPFARGAGHARERWRLAPARPAPDPRGPGARRPPPLPGRRARRGEGEQQHADGDEAAQVGRRTPTGRAAEATAAPSALAPAALIRTPGTRIGVEPAPPRGRWAALAEHSGRVRARRNAVCAAIPREYGRHTPIHRLGGPSPDGGRPRAARSRRFFAPNQGGPSRDPFRRSISGP